VIRFPALLAALAAALAFASQAEAAAPNYILVTGPGLRHPVLLASWDENAALLVATRDAPRASPDLTRGLSQRRRFELAEFWGWRDRPRPTRPSQANQYGWFYPAHAERPALIDMMVEGLQVPRLAPARVLAILRRHRVPTRY